MANMIDIVFGTKTCAITLRVFGMIAIERIKRSRL